MPRPPRRDSDQEDPRYRIAKFFGPGDTRGPAGTLLKGNLKQQREKETRWFAVFRPTSRDAIDHLNQTTARGKSLNIKGKSAKKGRLSGLVPFLQISKNEHKKEVGTANKEATIKVYFTSLEARQKAYTACRYCLQEIVEAVEAAEIMQRGRASKRMTFDEGGVTDMFKALNKKMVDPDLDLLNQYAPKAYGLKLPELLLREAYVEEQDITQPPGWETGRASEPAFMDMNLHALREKTDPEVVLYQVDEDPMNPRGLVMAYAEQEVLPVVSDFDPFMLGSRGMQFTSITPEDVELIKWSLEGIERVLKSGSDAWTSDWLAILKTASAKGFHPKLPKFGFGDQTTYGVVADLVDATDNTGAIRHGTECFNWYFPQELDDEFLVVWEGFTGSQEHSEESSSTGVWDSLMCSCSSPTKVEVQPSISQTVERLPWSYLSERKLREFLLARIKENYSFPLNPAWVVRDEGWWDVLAAMQSREACKQPLSAWFPPPVLQRVDELHKAFPNGLVKKSAENGEHVKDPLEKADEALLMARRHKILKRAKAKFRAAVIMEMSKSRAEKGQQALSTQSVMRLSAGAIG